MKYGDGQQLSTSTRTQRGLELTPAFEKHYSVKELANLWNLSDRTIRRMFVGEPGVVEWGTCERRMKRAYKTLRIPESVARRVHRRLRRVG
jgi:transcriptional regulator GlxA family with amidase domain